MADLVGVRPGLLAPLHDAGEPLGPLRPEPGVQSLLVAVGSQGTASAVVGVPAEDERFAYICCGTWGLVGVELEWPVLTMRAGRLVEAAGLPPGPLIDVDDPCSSIGPIAARIAQACRRLNAPPAAVVRCILDSLAAAVRPAGA